MKKTIILLGLLFISVISNAQLKEIDPDPIVQISKIGILGETYISFNNLKGSNEYFINYKDKQYQQITDFKTLHIGNKETVIQLKDLMLDMLKNKIKKKAIELNENTIHFKKRSNTIEMTVFNKLNQMSIVHFINKKQINKLFPTDKLK